LAQVPIVTGEPTDKLEVYVAEELADILSRMYTGNSFVVTNRLPPGSGGILVGTRDTYSRIAELVTSEELSRPGSYVIKTVTEGKREFGVIAGKDTRAVLHGAYSLLEKLGCGFYLSYSHIPVYRGAKIDFKKWQMSDFPMFPERIVLNWHSFISSCSSWDLAEWQAWIKQIARMRYTAMMVHAYGNNPMVCFTHNDQTKPVGYLTTTYSGRDWGTEHVNDVRRLYGGDVFEGPGFGSGSAMVPDDGRVAAAKGLMERVFASAKEAGLDVVFALDVDTETSNPANIIGTLPFWARMKAGGYSVANPDTPEGYAFYRSQIVTLMSDYPQVSRLVAWFRGGGTPWRNILLREFTSEWRDQFTATVRKKPAIPADHAYAPSMFAISRITAAFRKILDDLGRTDVKLGIGSWDFDFMSVADVFNAPEVAFFPLDSSIRFEEPKVKEQLAAVGLHRSVIPVLWSQHDDRTYLGRPYRPFDYFASDLDEMRASGFGIIHWTTRPLDLYFKSLSDQVWVDGRDMRLKDTCLNMAERTFGPVAREKMGEYLYRFVTEGPQFGRETTDRFIDHSLPVDETIALSGQRQELLSAVDTNRLDKPAREHFEYYRGLEKFFVEFFRTEGALQTSMRLVNEGQTDKAKQLMRSCKPEQVIELYRDSARQGGITKGEQAIIVSLNLRWLPYFTAQKQMLGLEARRIAFRPTRHDALAHGAGTKSFFFDTDKCIWIVLGTQETRHETYELGADVVINKGNLSRDAYRDVCAGGLRCKAPLVYTSEILPAGKYKVRVLFCEYEFTKAKERILSVSVAANDNKLPPQSIDIFKEAGDCLTGLEAVFPVEIKNPDTVRVMVHAVRREAIVSGIVIEPE